MFRRLTRYFWIATLLGVTVTVGALFVFYERLSFNNLVQHESRANETATQWFLNVLWPRYAEFVARAHTLDPASLKSDPNVERIHGDVVEHLRGTTIAKVKIYDTHGVTVFSSETAQVGKNESGNANFIAAMRGTTTSVFTSRDRFHALEGSIRDRKLVSTYVPARIDGHIVGVFELYSDVTPLVADIERTRWQLIVGVMLSLACLYTFLYYLLRRSHAEFHETERARQSAEKKLLKYAFYDSLTGLPNRRKLRKYLDKQLSQKTARERLLALLFVDLDGFKFVNDSLGHGVGDQLLRVVSDRMCRVLRQPDRLFRMGGDEFLVVVNSAKTVSQASALAERLVRAISQPVSLDGHEVHVGASIGVAASPIHTDKSDTLVKYADVAMYRAKGLGGERVVVYSGELSARSLETLELQSGLARALERNEFRLVFQPRLDVVSGELVACEALLRWRHPTRGLLSPAEFIDALEASGRIIEVGEWVLREACRAAVVWQSKGLAGVRVSVNVSPRQFETSGFAAKIGAILDVVGLEARNLEIELTESALARNVGEARRILTELNSLGVLISVDDFGTGYSSLNYLAEFPLDYLKIDRSFTSHLGTDSKHAMVAASVCALAESLAIKTVAEGVETPDQERAASRLGCHEVQGDHVSIPLVVEALWAFAQRRNARQRRALHVVS